MQTLCFLGLQGMGISHAYNRTVRELPGPLPLFASCSLPVVLICMLPSYLRSKRRPTKASPRCCTASCKTPVNRTTRNAPTKTHARPALTHSVKLLSQSLGLKPCVTPSPVCTQGVLANNAASCECGGLAHAPCFFVPFLHLANFKRPIPDITLDLSLTYSYDAIKTKTQA